MTNMPFRARATFAEGGLKAAWDQGYRAKSPANPYLLTRGPEDPDDRWTRLSYAQAWAAGRQARQAQDAQTIDEL